MRHYARKAAAAGFLVFMGLWIVGTVRGLTLPYPPPAPISISSEREFFSSSAQQYASANNLKQIHLVETPLPLLLDGPDVDKIRIHEKRAVLTTNTAAFDTDNGAIRSAIFSHNAEIFTYKETGIEPSRRIVLEIGVQADKFDDLVKALRGIGTLTAVNIEQKDRTDEFRKLYAQRQALKKNLEAIGRLREGRTLSLDDALKFEQKVQDLEEKIQNLRIQFGDLLGKESYYHVHLTLAEYQPGDRGDRTYTVPQRIGHAFLWAVVWWLAAALTAALVIGVGVSAWVLREPRGDINARS
jgi:hypothetical protein